MTMKYRAATDTVTGQMAIFATESLPFNSTSEFPVARFGAVEGTFPLEVQKLAENIADLLSHRTPVHTLSSGNRGIFYTRTPSSIILKTHTEGVSQDALTLTVSDTSSVADYGADMLALIDQDFMQRVCDKITPDPEAGRTLERQDSPVRNVGHKPGF